MSKRPKAKSDMTSKQGAIQSQLKERLGTSRRNSPIPKAAETVRRNSGSTRKKKSSLLLRSSNPLTSRISG